MGHTAIEEKYMYRAIELAKKGSGRTNPNPLVGAVIVRDGQILSEGYHECYGQYHAERNAIVHAREAGIDLKGSTIYVTLEPCCHHGKQPPCTDAILESGISRVVVGSDDPNPLVSGRGYEILRKAGLQVVTHFLKEECDAINDVFFHFIRHRTPFVAMKYAMTMDGKIACHTGDSKWVTGETARAHVQKLRNHYRGIMVGIGTVLADDPSLNCRMEGGRNPIRIVVDSHLRIPMDSKLVKTAKNQPLIVACLEGQKEKADMLEQKGVTVAVMPQQDGHVSLPALMTYLGEEGIDGILLEGGGRLNESALEAGIVGKVFCYLAPKIFGGEDARTPVEGQGKSLAAEAWRFERTGLETLGEDLLITCKLKDQDEEQE